MGEHDEEISLVDLKVGQEVIKTELNVLCKDVNRKHRQNRRSIHIINNNLQKIADDIWRLKLKIAGYAGLGGLASGIITELLKFIISTMHK